MSFRIHCLSVLTCLVTLCSAHQHHSSLCLRLSNLLSQQRISTLISNIHTQNHVGKTYLSLRLLSVLSLALTLTLLFLIIVDQDLRNTISGLVEQVLECRNRVLVRVAADQALAVGQVDERGDIAG